METESKIKLLIGLTLGVTILIVAVIIGFLLVQNVSDIEISDWAGTQTDILSPATSLENTLSPVGEGITSESVEVYNNPYLSFDGEDDYVNLTGLVANGIHNFSYLDSENNWVEIVDNSLKPYYYEDNKIILGKFNETSFFNGSIKYFKIRDSGYVNHDEFNGRTGYSYSLTSPKVNNTLWKKMYASSTPEFDWFAGVSIVDNYVYAMQKNSNLNFTKFDARNGEISCSVKIGETDGTPVIYNDIAYLTTMNDTPGKYDGWYLGVVAINTSNCEIIWNSSIEEEMIGTVALNVDEGIVYSKTAKTSPTIKEKLYAFNSTNGEYLWNFTVDNKSYLSESFQPSSPTYYKGRIYFASPIYNINVTNNTNWNFLYSLNSSNGDLIWNTTNVSSVGVWDSSPVIYNDSLFIGLKSSYNQSRIVARYNATNGSLINFIGSPYSASRYDVFQTVAVHDNRVWFSTASSGVALSYYLNGTKFCEEYDLSWGSAYSSPVIADGVVYLVSNKQVRFLNESNCDVIGGYSTGETIFSQLAVSNGVLYFFSDDGYLYAVGEYLNTSSGNYKLNSNTGTIAYDSSGNENHGTITGATWNNDGILNTLTNGVDYTLNTATGLLTLASDYLYSYVEVAWDYSGFANAPVKNMRTNFTQGIENVSSKIPLLFSIAGVILILGVLGLIFLVYQTLNKTTNAI